MFQGGFNYGCPSIALDGEFFVVKKFQKVDFWKKEPDSDGLSANVTYKYLIVLVILKF